MLHLNKYESSKKLYGSCFATYLIFIGGEYLWGESYSQWWNFHPVTATYSSYVMIICWCAHCSFGITYEKYVNSERWCIWIMFDVYCPCKLVHNAVQRAYMANARVRYQEGTWHIIVYHMFSSQYSHSEHKFCCNSALWHLENVIICTTSSQS